MQQVNQEFKPFKFQSLIALVSTLLLLSACGGGGSSVSNTSQDSSLVATGTSTLQIDLTTLPDAVAMQQAQPFFHAAPALLVEPSDVDVIQSDTSANRAPQRQSLSAQLSDLSSRHLTVQALQDPQAQQMLRSQGAAFDNLATPMASNSVIATYTPAQIRAAYGLPALPAAGATLTAAQAAQLGAGQTIYIVDANHDPNVAAELAAFNQKFGLSTCTSKAIPVMTALPLAKASSAGCELAVVYNTASGSMSSTAPAYDAGWATEITLDVQWAHATAPLARIILIEAPDASINSLLGSIKLANAMGPGVVSMSFGAGEGSWTASVDAVFTGGNMNYLAATGDNGAGVSWPSVSSNVVAVGGTTLSYSGSGIRSEVSWSGTGGGISAYTPTPSYQTSIVPGLGSVARRSVADVAFNADPASGQYVAVMTPGSSSVNWMSIGGTSLSTPQWAGLLAVVNATRAQLAKPVLTSPHAILYGQISTVPGTYASSFYDVTKGSNGACLICVAKTGYDSLTGLGTPNVTNLLSAMVGSNIASAPVVNPSSIRGMVGTPLTFTVSTTAVNPLVYSLNGTPTGLSINGNGVVSWTSPIAGTYAVTVVAKDIVTGLSGQAVYSVTIAPPPAPVVSSGNISGKVGASFSFATTITANNPVSYSLSGAPVGMSINAAGVVTWSTPIAGNYVVTVIAKDSKTGLSGQGIYNIAIAAIPAPIVAAVTVNAKPGVALTVNAIASSVNPLTYSLNGAPAGMTISSAGVISWPKPVVGTYAVTVVAKDTRTGLSGQGTYTFKVAVAGPVITAATMTGVVGKPLTGSINFAAPGATSLSISISGVPLGMTFSVSGQTIIANWAKPVLGNFSLNVVAVDSAKLSAQVNVPIIITTK